MFTNWVACSPRVSYRYMRRFLTMWSERSCLFSRHCGIDRTAPKLRNSTLLLNFLFIERYPQIYLKALRRIRHRNIWKLLHNNRQEILALGGLTYNCSAQPHPRLLRSSETPRFQVPSIPHTPPVAATSTSFSNRCNCDEALSTQIAARSAITQASR
jgi:hypothetical protein